MTLVSRAQELHAKTPTPVATWRAIATMTTIVLAASCVSTTTVGLATRRLTIVASTLRAPRATIDTTTHAMAALPANTSPLPQILVAPRVASLAQLAHTTLLAGPHASTARAAKHHPAVQTRARTATRHRAARATIDTATHAMAALPANISPLPQILVAPRVASLAQLAHTN